MAIAKLNKDGFINYLNSIDPHSIYVWGGQGQYLKDISASWIRSKDTKGESYANRSIVMWEKNRGYANAQCFDCSGLAMYYIQNMMGASGDLSSNSLKNECTQIDKSQLQVGDFVFKIYTSGSKKGQAYHIGYVVDANGTIFSARGRDYNVPYRNETGWNWFGRPKFWESVQPVVEGYPVTRNLKKGHKGEDVRAMQNALMDLGYACKGGADGSFGSGTLKALKQFQTNEHIKVDGIAGKNTIGLLARTNRVYWAG